MATNGWRPDPSKGVFETLLVVDGEPVELDAHLARLQRSLDEIYNSDVPAGAREELIAGADGISLGRLRLTCVPDEDGLRHDLIAGEVVPEAVFPERGAELRSHSVQGGHGSHKWVDRRGMEHPDAGPGQLICDGDELLEAGWANLFAVREETLWTPPADGRILPGTARAAVLAIAHTEGFDAQEQPLRASDLQTAEETFLTNSIRGIEPATALDGTPLPGCGPISRRLADELRRRWSLPAHKAAATAPKQSQLSH
ncbi:MAG TPA: aminotransferase class IV [Solirubrobacterales bacterium]|nr:aminotransferase class IV [Solirubrobacterales bacterium]